MQNDTFVLVFTCRLGTSSEKRTINRTYSERGTTCCPAVWGRENKDQADSKRCCPGLCQGESFGFIEWYS